MNINIVELATELAERELLKDSITLCASQIYKEDEDGNEIYTEYIQEKFNNLYDEFYNIIENCKTM